MIKSTLALSSFSILLSSCFFDSDSEPEVISEPVITEDTALLNDTTGLVAIGRDFASQISLINASSSLSSGKIKTSPAPFSKLTSVSSLDPELSELDHKTPNELYNSLTPSNGVARFPASGLLSSNYGIQNENFYLTLEPVDNGDHYQVKQTTYKNIDFFLDSVVYVYYVEKDDSNWTYLSKTKNSENFRYESWQEYFSSGLYGERSITSSAGDNKKPSQWILPSLEAPYTQISSYTFEGKPNKATEPAEGTSQWNSSSDFTIYTNANKSNTKSEGVEYYSEALEGTETYGRSLAYQLEQVGKGKWATETRTVIRAQVHYPTANQAPAYSHSIALNETGNIGSKWKTEVTDIYTKFPSQTDYYRSTVSIWTKGTEDINFDDKYSTSSHQFLTVLNPVANSNKFTGDSYERWSQGGSYNHYSLSFENNVLTKTWANSETPHDSLLTLKKTNNIKVESSLSELHIDLNQLPEINLYHSSDSNISFTGLFNQGVFEGTLTVEDKETQVEIHKGGIYYLEAEEWNYLSF